MSSKLGPKLGDHFPAFLVINSVNFKGVGVVVHTNQIMLALKVKQVTGYLPPGLDGISWLIIGSFC